MVRQRRPLAGPQITEMLAVKKPTVLTGSEPFPTTVITEQSRMFHYPYY